MNPLLGMGKVNLLVNRTTISRVKKDIKDEGTWRIIGEKNTSRRAALIRSLTKMISIQKLTVGLKSKDQKKPRKGYKTTERRGTEERNSKVQRRKRKTPH